MWRALGGLCTGSGRAVGAHGARHIFVVFLINARRASQSLYNTTHEEVRATRLLTAPRFGSNLLNVSACA